MKKKLVSILLSLSMCAAYAMPLTTVAAEEPAEAQAVVETVAPDAKAWSPTATSPNAFKITKVSPSSIDVYYGQEIDLETEKIIQCVFAGSETGSAISNANTNLTFSIPNSKDSKFLSLSGTKVKGLALTKNPVTVCVTAKTNDGKYSAEGQLSINVKAMDLSKLEDINCYPVVQYKKSADNKKYKNLDEFIKKYKGAKGLTVKIIKNVGLNEIAEVATLSKKDISKVEVRAVSGSSKPTGCEYYTDNGNADGDAVANVQISVEGKKNYTGKTGYDCTYDGDRTSDAEPYGTNYGANVNLEPQKISAGTISGQSVTYGSIASVIDGAEYDDGATTAAITAENVKNFKFSTKSKNIKVNAKGEVTVKKIGATDAENEVEVTISNKKNKKAEGKVKFNIIPMTISGASNVDVSKALKKTYKSLADFEKKFVGADKTKAKASGLVFKQKVNSKDVKLKAGGKDFNVTVTGMGIKGDGDAYFTDSNKTAISTGCQLILEGKGNFAGAITCDPMTVKLEIQTVAVSGGSTSGPSVTFGDTDKNILDWIYVDKSDTALKNASNKTDLLKGLKITAEKSLKIDKEGKITVKSVPDSGKAKVTVTAKKNKSSKDAVAEAEIAVEKLDVTNNTKFALDSSKVGSKTFKSKSAAETALKKVAVTYDGKKLKLNKDFETPTLGTIADTTGTAIDVDVTVKMKGNYKGEVAGKVSVTKSAN